MSDDGNHWWDGQAWQPINWQQAITAHGQHQASRWGMYQSEWDDFYQAAMQAIGHSMHTANKIEWSGAIADASTECLHAHGLAAAAAVQAHGSENAGLEFVLEGTNSNWYHTFLSSLSGASITSDPMAPARAAAADADATVQGHMEPAEFQTYQQALQYP